MVGFCEYGNESLGSIKMGNFLTSCQGRFYVCRLVD